MPSSPSSSSEFCPMPYGSSSCTAGLAGVVFFNVPPLDDMGDKADMGELRPSSAPLKSIIENTFFFIPDPSVFSNGRGLVFPPFNEVGEFNEVGVLQPLEGS
mmetsp:Transcript_58525/g.119697  ORF Transcript_58525/g.119697 Transcript_58525/m.119697 type:complete len:102 (-) Transcript_58525:172-477(-)